MSEPSIAILDYTSFEGPNVWSQHSITWLLLDMRAAGRRAGLNILNGIEQIERMLAKPGQNMPSSTSFRNAMHGREPSLAVVVETVMIEVQRRAGINVSFSTSRPAQTPGTYEIAVQHEHPEIGAAAGVLAIQLLELALAGGDPEPGVVEGLFRQFTTMVESRTLPFGPRSVVDAARQRHIPVQWVESLPSRLELGTGAYRRRFSSMTTSRTSRIGVKIAGSKQHTKQVLREAGLPVPGGMVAATVDQAVNAANEIGYPVVLKPENGNQGRGVFVGITEDSGVRDLFSTVAAAGRSYKVLIERFVTGSDYRVLVVNGQIVGVNQRRAAQVVGDGLNTVRALIDIENADPRRGVGTTNVLTRITIDAQTGEALRSQGLALDDVPVYGQPVQVKLACNTSTGGTATDRTGVIHPDNAEIARMAARAVDLDIAGVDIVTPDISLSMWTSGGAIIEVNSGPGFRQHLYPFEGTPRDVGAAVIDMLFPPGQPVRAPVVAVAAAHASSLICQLIGHIIASAGFSAGLATRDGLVIDGMFMRGVDSRGPAGIRTLLNNPAVEVAITEVDARQLVDHGLGFDSCDIAVITSLSGLTTPYGQPVESVLAAALDASGSLVLAAGDPELTRLARHHSLKVLYFESDLEESLGRSHGEPGHPTVVVQQAPSGNVIALITGDAVAVVCDVTECTGLPESATGTATPGLLAAIAAAIAYGIPLADIRRALQTFKSVYR